MCEFLKDRMRLDSLMKLVVEGGLPNLGWDGLPTYSVADFKTLFNVKYEALEWVWHLLSIQAIRSLDVSSELRNCPPSHSSGTALFVAFSSSIETGFSDYLRSEMVAA